MKKEHISFNSIDCESLQYISTSKTWVCLDILSDLSDCDFCQRCRFAKLRAIERQIRKEFARG